MNQRHRGTGRRNAPLTTFLLALPLALLTRCASTTDGAGDPNPGLPEGPDEIPVVECTSAAACELPRSTCSGRTLVYYTSARCEAGRCVWDELTTACVGPCSEGGCQNPTMTAAGTPPFDPCAGGFAGNAGGCAGQPGTAGSAGVADDGGSMTCDADEDGGPGPCVP